MPRTPRQLSGRNSPALSSFSTCILVSVVSAIFLYSFSFVIELYIDTRVVFDVLSAPITSLLSSVRDVISPYPRDSFEPLNNADVELNYSPEEPYFKKRLSKQNSMSFKLAMSFKLEDLIAESNNGINTSIKCYSESHQPL